MGAKTGDLARRHGVSVATIYNWKSKYGGLELSEAPRLRELESKNARLKRLLADAMLDQAVLKDPLAKSGDARCQTGAVAHLQHQHGMSERRACRVIDADRESVHYRSMRDDDPERREKLRHLGLARGILACHAHHRCRSDAEQAAQTISVPADAAEPLLAAGAVRPGSQPESCCELPP